MTRSRDVADTQDNSGGAVAPFVAGKNAVINGGMDFFQRSSFVSNNAYCLDRWYINAGTTTTVTQSTTKTTPNSQYMMLMVAGGTQQIFPQQAIETKNAIYYAGKTVTLSAYAAGLTTTTNWQMDLGYSTSADNAITGTWTSITATGGNPNLTLSSTVTRFSATYNIPSDAKSLRVFFGNNAANITVGQGIYLGDVQLEQGSVMTPFARAGGSIGGELALCQRYYYRLNWDALSSYQIFGQGGANSTTQARTIVPFGTQLRVKPTAIDYPTVATYFTVIDFADAGQAATAVSLDTNQSSSTAGFLLWTVTSGLTANRPYIVRGSNSTGAYLGWSAEL